MLLSHIYFLIITVFNIQPRLRCQLNTRADFSEPLPVIIRNGKLLEPDDDYGNVNLENGETITLSCEGEGSIQHPNAINHVSTASITCEGGTTFSNVDWLSGPSQFRQFHCNAAPSHLSQRTTRTCYENHPVIEVGFKINNVFYPAYESCFDEGSLRVIYTKYTQKPYNALFQTRVGREVRQFFLVDRDIFGYIPVDSLFSPKGQKGAVAALVGRMIDNYITSSEFLARGHLAAKTDFVFAFTERATFHYVNCAPQWSGFNGGNWNTLEVDLRNHVHNSKYNTIVYTGTYGVSQLMNEYQTYVDLYLTNDNNNNPVMPVPLYFYKVIYEPGTRRGTAFVGINNPYYNIGEAHDLFFCKDVCRGNSDFRWLSWNPDNPSAGYCFCCTVTDFRDTVKHLPSFEVFFLGLLVTRAHLIQEVILDIKDSPNYYFLIKLEKSTGLRFKRQHKNNVIEEENHATVISEIQSIYSEPRLNSRIVYNNVHE